MALGEFSAQLSLVPVASIVENCCRILLLWGGWENKIFIYRTTSIRQQKIASIARLKSFTGRLLIKMKLRERYKLAICINLTSDDDEAMEIAHFMKAF